MNFKTLELNKFEHFGNDGCRKFRTVKVADLRGKNGNQIPGNGGGSKRWGLKQLENKGINISESQ